MKLEVVLPRVYRYPDFWFNGPRKCKKPNREGRAKCKNNNRKILAPRPGLEPGAYGLTAGQTHKSLASRLKNCNRFFGWHVAAGRQPNLCRTKPFCITEKLHAPHVAQRVPNNGAELFPNVAAAMLSSVKANRTKSPNLSISCVREASVVARVRRPTQAKTTETCAGVLDREADLMTISTLRPRRVKQSSILVSEIPRN